MPRLDDATMREVLAHGGSIASLIAALDDKIARFEAAYAMTSAEMRAKTDSGEMPMTEYLEMWRSALRVREELQQCEPLVITRDQAADLLNVPSSYLDRLLEDGRLSCDPHGDMLFSDVMGFREVAARERSAALDELFRLTEELGLYEMEYGKKA